MHPRPQRPETAIKLHATSTRVRLRVPARRRDGRWFEAAATRLAAEPGVAGVHCNPATATLTVQVARQDQETNVDPLESLRRAGIVVAAASGTRGAAGLRQGRAPRASRPRPDAAVSEPGLLQRTQIDRRQLALAVFLLLAARHLLRSGWLLPALALGWFLMETFPSLRPTLGRRRPSPGEGAAK